MNKVVRATKGEVLVELRRPSTIILSLLLSISTLVGYSLNTDGTILPPMSTKQATLALALGFLVLWLSFTVATAALMSLLNNILLHGDEDTAPSSKHAHLSTTQNPARRLPLRNVLYGLFMFLCWAPYIISAWPGNTHGDFLYQLMQYLGSEEITSHHPLIMTQLFGLLFSLGSNFGGPNGGIAAIVLAQSFTMIVLFVASLSLFEKWGLPRGGSYLLLLFYTLNPIFPLFATFCIKDTFSACLMTLFYLLLFDLLYGLRIKGNTISIPLLVALLILAVLAGLSRKNCIYVIIPTLVLAALVGTDNRKSLLALTFGVAVCFLLLSKCLSIVSGAEKGSIFEAFSVPCQQTAAYIKHHGDDMTDSEREAVSDIIVIDNLEDLGVRYTYKVSDPVKICFVSDPTRDQLIRYFEAWASMGMKDPRLYLNVFLHGNYGYWYIALNAADVKWGNTFNMLPTVYLDQLIDQNFQVTGPSEVLKDIYTRDESLHDTARTAVDAMGSLPVIEMLFRPATYVWFMAIMSVWLLRNKRLAGIMALPALLSLLVCCISPDFSNMRYALPLVFMAPIFIGAGFVGTGTAGQEMF